MAKYLCLRRCPFRGKIYVANEQYDLEPRDNPPKHFKLLGGPEEKKAHGKAAKAKAPAEAGPDAERAALLEKAKALEIQVDGNWTTEQLAHAVVQAESNPPKLPG